jgi:hypothetical protein
MKRDGSFQERGVFISSRAAVLSTLTVLWIVCASTAAQAQDPGIPSGDANGMPAPAMTPPAAAPVPPPAPAAAPPVSTGGVVEELPATAYPEPYTRGLYGGSLWSTFHGLQWPFYPRTGIGVSGYAWLDNSYEKVKVGITGQNPFKEYLQQGRFLLRVTPTYSNDVWFVQAQAELVANKDQNATQPAVADTDDLWVRAGQWNKWDVTVGRFEGFEVYHLGMGLDLNTEERNGAFDQSNSPPGLYGASYLFYRPAGAGNVAFHLYPSRFLRFELLGQLGSVGGRNEIGARPALVFDIGWVKLKAAGEYQWLDPRVDDGTTGKKRNRGVGGTAQFVLSQGVEFGGNVGYAINDEFLPIGTLDNNKSGNTLSVGGFFNGRPPLRIFEDWLVGGGVNYVTFENLHVNTAGAHDKSTNLQAFVALQYLIGRQLFVKLVGAYAKSHFEPSFSNMDPYNDSMTGVRLRVMYLF